MAYELQKISDKHFEIIRLKILGAKNSDIARRLGITPQSVRGILNSPVIRQQMEMMQAARNVQVMDIQTELEEYAPESLEFLKEVQEDEEVPVAIRVGVAKDILDRAGYGKVIKKEISNTHTGEITGLIGRVKERFAAQNIEDTTYTEVEPELLTEGD